MKKTLTVNLGGTVFNIDEDAYRLLDRYLSNLRCYFEKEPGADEIMKDFELRISELFSEKTAAGYQVMTVEDAQEVIGRIGKPEELSGEGRDESRARRSDDRRPPHKLYRDPDDKILGGVAGGMAAYMGWDATMIRIVFLLLLFLPFIHFPITFVYILLWMLVPLANTAAEKLAMRGERVTVENIGRTVGEGFGRIGDGMEDYFRSGKPRSVLKKVCDAVVAVVGILLKVFMAMVVIVCIPIVFVLLVCILAFAYAMMGVAVGSDIGLLSRLSFGDGLLAQVSPTLGAGLSVCLLLLVGIPLSGLAYALLSRLFTSWKPMRQGVKWGMFALWVVSLAVAVVLWAKCHYWL